jgi:aryl-alcohol dehydrogenase-like predicted oxidoreductase
MMSNERNRPTQRTGAAEPTGLTRRSFFTHAAVAGAAGIAGGVLGASAPAEAKAGAVPSAGVIPKRPFGSTGTEITMVGFGAGSRFYGPIAHDEDAAELIRQAIDRGIEFVETGGSYGPDGLSEKRIGLAMNTHRSKVFLETKIDERNYSGAMREMERSMNRMNTDHLDLVLHHFLRDPEEVEQVAGADGAERALRQMIDEKVVRFRGVSTHTPVTALAAIERLDPQAIQLPINAVRVPDFEPGVIPQAVEQGIAVIAMKTCGNGYFFPANATTPDRIERYGPPEGAWDRWDLPDWTDYIHYVLSLPITTATIGIDSYFTLNGIVAAASAFEPIGSERKASITERAQVFATTGYWIPRG